MGLHPKTEISLYKPRLVFAIIFIQIREFRNMAIPREASSRMVTRVFSAVPRVSFCSCENPICRGASSSTTNTPAAAIEPTSTTDPLATATRPRSIGWLALRSLFARIFYCNYKVGQNICYGEQMEHIGVVTKKRVFNTRIRKAKTEVVHGVEMYIFRRVPNIELKHANVLKPSGVPDPATRG